MLTSLRYVIGTTWLRVAGWELEKGPPMPRRFVVIAAPHTSNWDLPFTMATAWSLRLRIRWLGKHTLFKPPFGWAFRAMGGIPVDRRAPQGLVAQVVARFGRASDLIVAVPPEGTRKQVSHWKSGFYHIARGAEVPIGLGFLDFGRRRCGIGGYVQPTGDIAADMDRIRDFYKDIRGRHPHRESPMRLREEEPVPA